MRSFTQIQQLLGPQPAIKKIYLIGCTGAGKTSLVQHILDTAHFGFPATTHRRTTVTPTEYMVKKDLAFKTTIVLKHKDDIINSVKELVEGAVIKAATDELNIEDIIFELEQSPDERFKPKQMVAKTCFEQLADVVFRDIVPLIAGKDVNDETILKSVGGKIDSVVEKLVDEIYLSFNNTCKDYNQADEQTLCIEGFEQKQPFIEENKRLLSQAFGSISLLTEYVRIEGNLIAEWLDSDLEFMIIDGEGIGHDLIEKADTLSVRHYDYFEYCNSVVLVDDANDPFAGGGKGAIEGIILSGYENKFKLVFSKVDKLELADQNAYFRRNLNNLKNALKADGIELRLENRNTYKLSKLNNSKIDDVTKKEIGRLLNSIDSTPLSDLVTLEYDFSSILQGFARDELFNTIVSRIDKEHWAVVKAFSRRLKDGREEYRHLKPISWILVALMQDISQFLQKDELSSSVIDSQNLIKQKFSQLTIETIRQQFIVDNDYLWQQAYEKSGRGSDRERKQFIHQQIVTPFLPKKNQVGFELFKGRVKHLLVEAGACELKTPKHTVITHVSIKKIFGSKNIEWSLGEDISILIGKNGCGKSTVLKLIYACINNDKATLEQFGSPYVELTLLKTFDNDESQTSTISHVNTDANLHAELVDTFDIKSLPNDHNVVDLDSQLMGLSKKFGDYQRSLVQMINKQLGDDIEQRTQLINRIAEATPDDLQRLQRLSKRIEEYSSAVNQPIVTFKQTIDDYFAGTEKQLIIDDERSPLLIKVGEGENEKIIEITELSSGEKQLLVIFLTVLLQQGRAFILLMDEPETSLHVEWQARFIDDIKQLNSNMQIIVATHNPLILLNRESNEIGIISANNEQVSSHQLGTKYLDVSSVLLEHFGLSSLIGSQMQRDIKRFNELKLRVDSLSEQEQQEFEVISDVLANSLAGEIIYDDKYFAFLKFLKEHKQLDIEQYQQSSAEEMTAFLQEFGEQVLEPNDD